MYRNFAECHTGDRYVTDCYVTCMARPTADTAQITFRLPMKWLERADEVAAGLALAGRPMGRTDGVRALIAAGLTMYSSEIGRLADLIARDLTVAGKPPVTREEAMRVALEQYGGDREPKAKRKTNTKRVRKTK